MPQSWQCEIEVYKATYHFIYAQKNFFTGNVSLLLVANVSKVHPPVDLLLLWFADLIEDWASDSKPDIYSFTPYSWKFKVLFHQFEMIWAANQHNWIDCSTKQQENGERDFHNGHDTGKTNIVFEKCEHCRKSLESRNETSRRNSLLWELLPFQPFLKSY